MNVEQGDSRIYLESGSSAGSPPPALKSSQNGAVNVEPVSYLADIFDRYWDMKMKYFNRESSTILKRALICIDDEFNKIEARIIETEGNPKVLARLRDIKRGYESQFQESYKTYIVHKSHMEFVSFKELESIAKANSESIQAGVKSFIPRLLKISGFLAYVPSETVYQAERKQCSENGSIEDAHFNTFTGDPHVQDIQKKDCAQPSPDLPYIEEVSPNILVTEVKKKPSNQLKPEITSYLESWVKTHLEEPYPTIEEKMQIHHSTGLSLKQIENWMVNYRVRKLRYNKNTRTERIRSKVQLQLNRKKLALGEDIKIFPSKYFSQSP